MAKYSGWTFTRAALIFFFYSWVVIGTAWNWTFDTHVRHLLKHIRVMYAHFLRNTLLQFLKQGVNISRSQKHFHRRATQMNCGTFRDKLFTYLWKYRGYDYHGSDPTEISRIRRIGLLLPGTTVVSLKMLTRSSMPALYPRECWHASMHYRHTFSPVSPLSPSVPSSDTTIHSTIHPRTRHRRLSDQQPWIEISDRD